MTLSLVAPSSSAGDSDITSELEALGEQLRQIQGIVSGATNALASGFAAIAEHSAEQQKVLEASLDLFAGSAGHSSSLGRFMDETMATTSGAFRDLEATADSVVRLADRVEEVSRALGRVGRVTEAMRGLTEQTRILALNASIQATRAGQAGVGFGVVASSVQELSTGFSTLTSEVSEVIENVQVTLKTAMAESRAMSTSARRTVAAGQGSIETLKGSAQALSDDLRQSLVHAQGLQRAITKGVGDCVRGLQFDDLVGQISNLGLRRLALVRPVGIVLREVAELGCGMLPKLQQALSVFATARGSVRQAMVSQTSVEEGDVELF
jgi:methyl-accepting chemotaxis protein